jgi:hypothetical protein
MKMLERTITYIDYEGNERTETHYFNLNKSETIKWLTTTGEYTLDKVLMRLSEEKNGRKIMEIIEDLIHRSYGRKSLDGRKFEKSEEIWLDFFQTEAYSEFFSEIVTDAKKAAAFVNGIIPKDVAEAVSKQLSENKDSLPDELKDYVE